MDYQHSDVPVAAPQAALADIYCLSAHNECMTALQPFSKIRLSTRTFHPPPYPLQKKEHPKVDVLL